MNRPALKAHILVVEDNADVRNIISIYLKRNGYSVTEAVDGIIALDEIKRTPPDVILLDVLLPRLDGIETLKRLRTMDNGADVPVIMMSAVLQIKDIRLETARHSVASFLQKPFQMRTVIEHIEAARRIKQSAPKTRVAPPDTKKATQIQMIRKPFRRSGELGELTIPEILHAIFVESRTGKLQINSAKIEKRVFFQNGIPVYAESSLPEETLGAHLVEKRLITQTQHNKAARQMTQTGRHFGEVLLKLGLLGPHELFTEIESHLTNKVISIFEWRAGSYEFDAGDAWKEDVIVARMTPGRILLDGIQKHWSPAEVQRWLKITDNAQAYPLETSPYLEDQLGLSTQEARVFRMAKRQTSVVDIVKQVKDLKMATGTLMSLYIMEHIGFVLDPNESALDALTANESDVSKQDDRAQALLSEYIKLRTADYFKLLGVSRDATNDEISQAFKKRQRRYHPDTLIGIDTGLVHEKAEELFVRIHNAYNTLIDPSTKERYIQRIDRKTSGAVKSMTPKKPPYRSHYTAQESNDVTCFKEGLQTLQIGDFKRAIELFKQANDHTPKADYEGYISWAAYLNNPVGRFKSTEQTLLKLYKKNPSNVVFPYLLGSLAVKENNSKLATTFFTRALEVDPKHIDSARQLRLLKMRQPGGDQTGIFDIFKKKL